MWTLVLGAVLTFMSSWLLEGGMRRRARRTIKEDLELAAMLDGANDQAASALRGSANQRLDRYLTPLIVKLQRWAPSQRVIWAVGVVVALFALLGSVGLLVNGIAKLHLDTAAEALGTALAIGAVGTAAYVVLDLVLVPLVDRLAAHMLRREKELEQQQRE